MHSYAHAMGCTVYIPELWCAEVFLIISNRLPEIIVAWSPLVARGNGAPNKQEPRVLIRENTVIILSMGHFVFACLFVFPIAHQ